MAASNSSDTGQSLFPEGEPNLQVNFPRGEDLDPLTVWIRKTLFHDEGDTAMSFEEKPPQPPLSLRAWPYQERLLSRRVLDFCRKELSWECSELIDCQCAMPPYRTLSPYGTPDFEPPDASKYRYGRIMSSPSTLWDLTELWNDSVLNAYCERQLTFERDRLPALSGIAKQFLATGKFGRYVAGLWSAHFPWTLLWHVSMIPPIQAGIYSDSAPSWSWASLGIPFLYGFPPANLRATARICRYACPLASSDPTGVVKKCQMTISGKLSRGTIQHRASPDGCTQSSSQHGHFECRRSATLITASSWTVKSIDRCPAVGPHPIRRGELVFCLEIGFESQMRKVGNSDKLVEQGVYHGLILRHAPGAHGFYQRIGVCVRSREWMDKSNDEATII
jgi:hypothetical protein